MMRCAVVVRTSGMRVSAGQRAGLIHHRRSFVARAGGNTANNVEAKVEDTVPPGCSRYMARICKPLGIVLEESADGLLRVGDIQAGGNAERHNELATADNIIRKNDQLVAVSGFTRTGEGQVYGETEVRGGEKMVRILVGAQPQNKRFDIVVSAISSHLAGMEVSLEFQRCE